MYVMKYGWAWSFRIRRKFYLSRLGKVNETSDKDAMKAVMHHDAMQGVNTHLHESKLFTELAEV